MAYTTPRTWITGEIVTAALLNTHLRDNVSALANPPACRVNHNTTQSIPHDADTVVTFNSERYDTATMHDTSINPSRITITTAGIYLFSFTAEMTPANDYTQVYCFFQLNGASGAIGVGQSSMKTGGTSGFEMTVTTQYKFAVNDYVEVKVHQTNGASAARNMTSVNFYTPEVSATWIGLG